MTSSLLTLSPPNKLSSEFLFCFNTQSASMSLKIGENVVRVSNSLDLGETPSYLACYPDPSCLHIELQGVPQKNIKALGQEQGAGGGLPPSACRFF